MSFLCYGFLPPSEKDEVPLTLNLVEDDPDFKHKVENLNKDDIKQIFRLIGNLEEPET